MTYARARKDFEYLETLAECSDQITILDQVQDFMKEPTKAFATSLYEESVRLWFKEHGDQRVALDNRKVRSIAVRHNIDL